MKNQQREFHAWPVYSNFTISGPSRLFTAICLNDHRPHKVWSNRSPGERPGEQGNTINNSKKRKVAAIRLAGPGITRKTAARVLDALDGAASVMTRLRSRAGRPVVVSVDLPAVDGTVVPLWLGSLCTQLQLKREALPVFAELLHAAVQACGRRGLTGVLYFDDVTPGNIIRPDNARKCTTAYFRFAELGGAFRSVHGWLHVALIRRDEVKQVVGGMARVLA